MLPDSPIAGTRLTDRNGYGRENIDQVISCVNTGYVCVPNTESRDHRDEN
jgi:hypothetical protein